jgi:hypothetical protein
VAFILSYYQEEKKRVVIPNLITCTFMDRTVLTFSKDTLGIPLHRRNSLKAPCLFSGYFEDCYCLPFVYICGHIQYYCSVLYFTKVTADDLLPITVCLDCVYKLEMCHEFVHSCLEADAKLRDFLGFSADNEVSTNYIELCFSWCSFTSITVAFLDRWADTWIHGLIKLMNGWSMMVMV